MVFVAVLFLILVFGNFWGLIYLFGRMIKKSGDVASIAIDDAPRIASDIGSFVRGMLKWIFFGFLKSILAVSAIAYLIILAAEYSPK